MRSEIDSDKIILRSYQESFVPILFEAASESKGGDFSYWMPWCHENYTLKESREFIEKTVENRKNTNDIWREDMQLAYAVFDKQSGKFLGGAVLISRTHNINFIISVIGFARRRKINARRARRHALWRKWLLKIFRN